MSQERPRFPLRGSFKGDIDIGIDIDRGIDSDIVYSTILGGPWYLYLAPYL